MSNMIPNVIVIESEDFDGMEKFWSDLDILIHIKRDLSPIWGNYLQEFFENDYLEDLDAKKEDDKIIIEFESFNNPRISIWNKIINDYLPGETFLFYVWDIGRNIYTNDADYEDKYFYILDDESDKDRLRDISSYYSLEDAIAMMQANAESSTSNYHELKKETDRLMFDKVVISDIATVDKNGAKITTPITIPDVKDKIEDDFQPIIKKEIITEEELTKKQDSIIKKFYGKEVGFLCSDKGHETFVCEEHLTHLLFELLELEFEKVERKIGKTNPENIQISIVSLGTKNNIEKLSTKGTSFKCDFETQDFPTLIYKGTELKALKYYRVTLENYYDESSAQNIGMHFPNKFLMQNIQKRAKQLAVLK